MALHEFRNIVKHSDMHCFFHGFVPEKSNVLALFFPLNAVVDRVTEFF